MAYLFSKGTIHFWTGKFTGIPEKELPDYFMLSRCDGGRWCFEPLAGWLARQVARRR